MNDSLFWLFIFLIGEVLARIALEVREARITQRKGGIFAFLRLIPLVNDLTPLPENRREPTEGQFVKLHEEGHKMLHHGLLRNVYKVALLLMSLGVISFAILKMEASLWESFVWLHLVAFPGRIIFHIFCWNQEYEADRYAYGKLDRKIVRNALRELSLCEYPHTKLFALVYREHPTANLRKQKLNLK